MSKTHVEQFGAVLQKMFPSTYVPCRVYFGRNKAWDVQTHADKSGTHPIYVPQSTAVLLKKY